MEFGVHLDQTATKSSCDEKWHGIAIAIHVTFFTGLPLSPLGYLTLTYEANI